MNDYITIPIFVLLSLILLHPSIRSRLGDVWVLIFLMAYWDAIILLYIYDDDFKIKALAIFTSNAAIIARIFRLYRDGEN